MTGRLLSLDAFRGLTIAAMLLVNNPGDWGHVHAPLLHAAWHGWTPTDWIFPFFVFISGVSMRLSLSRRATLGLERRALMLSTMRRGAVLVFIGLVLNFIPAFSFETLRWPGVLQRLGLCTVLAAPLAIYLNARQQAAVALALLLLYSVLMLCVPVPGADGLLRVGSLLKGEDTAAYLDRLLMNGHLWAQAKTWDPEGLLSTLPALVSQITGLLAGHWLARPHSPAEKAAGLATAGLAALLLAEVLHVWNMPINKALWTPAFVAMSTGWACLVFAATHWLLDAQPSPAWRHRWARWLRPAIDFGLNALFLFVLSGLVAKLLGFVRMDGQSLKALLYAPLRDSGLAHANASLAFALLFVLVFYGVARLMVRRQWFIKV